MSEPQIPGQLRGTPAEGNPADPLPNETPGYIEGLTPNLQPYAASGNLTVNPSTPVQRPAQRAGEWKW